MTIIFCSETPRQLCRTRRRAGRPGVRAECQRLSRAQGPTIRHFRGVWCTLVQDGKMTVCPSLKERPSERHAPARGPSVKSLAKTSRTSNRTSWSSANPA